MSRRESETDSVLRGARAAKRPVMWALPVLRTRSYLGAVEFHAHAASSGSLSPCDLYLVNLGSVVRCKTFIRPPSSRATVVFKRIFVGIGVRKMAGDRQDRG